MASRNNLRNLYFVGPLLALASACDVPALPSRAATRIVNTCQSDADCGSGATCRSWLGPDGQTYPICFSTTVATTALLLEVTTDQLSVFGSAQTRYVTVNVDPKQSQQTANVVLPASATVRIFVTFADRLPSAQGCTWQTSLAQNLLGVRATFRPLTQNTVVSRISFTSDATPIYGTPGVAVPVSWSLPMTVPPGAYDIYLQSIDNPACPVPPVLLRNVTVPGDDINLSFPPRRTLAGALRLPPTVSFEGWTMEVVDSTTGAILSTPGTVGPPDASGRSRFGALRDGTFHPLEYTGPIDASASSQRYDVLLRARPPANVAQPVLVWDEGAITLGNNDLDLTDLKTELVSVTGKLVREGTTNGVEGAIWWRSRTITGSPLGVPSLFQRVATTAPDGSFSSQLVAGTYDVIVVPNERLQGVSRTEHIWSLAPLPSRRDDVIFEVTPPVTATLRVTSNAARQPLPSVRVQAVTPPPRRTTFDIALDASSLTARRTEGLTDAQGIVRLPLEGTGSFVVSLRPDPATGFPWSVLLPLPGRSSFTQPRELSVPWPYELSGVITTGTEPLGAPVRGGTLRVYVRNGSGTNAGYVPIGETTLGPSKSGQPDGFFRLLLPSSLPTSQDLGRDQSRYKIVLEVAQTAETDIH